MLHSYWKWPFIVSFPLKMVVFHSFLYVYQRVSHKQKNVRLFVSVSDPDQRRGELRSRSSPYSLFSSYELSFPTRWELYLYQHPEVRVNYYYYCYYYYYYYTINNANHVRVGGMKTDAGCSAQPLTVWGSSRCGSFCWPWATGLMCQWPPAVFFSPSKLGICHQCIIVAASGIAALGLSRNVFFFPHIDVWGFCF